MAEIKLSKDKKAALVSKIKHYFDDELNQEIGQFDAEFLLDFFSRELGPYLYNQGLQDARAILEAKLHDIDDAIYEIEQPV